MGSDMSKDGSGVSGTKAEQQNITRDWRVGAIQKKHQMKIQLELILAIFQKN